MGASIFRYDKAEETAAAETTFRSLSKTVLTHLRGFPTTPPERKSRGRWLRHLTKFCCAKLAASGRYESRTEKPREHKKSLAATYFPTAKAVSSA